jgi:hypothetical protein
MVAPKPPTPDTENDRSMYDSGYGDARGYYDDGAYVAAPPIGPVMPNKHSPVSSTNVTSISPHRAYTSHLLASFQRQRTLLRATPPPSAIEALNPKRCIVVMKTPFTQAFGEWQRAITAFDPSPVQIATLRNWSILTLLRLATSSLKRGRNLPTRMGAWVWALLAKLDYGILNRSEASTVRDFGKKAVWMRLGFDEKLAQATQGLIELHDEQEDEEEGEVQEEIISVADADANGDTGAEEQEVEMDISSEEEGEILDGDDELGQSGDVNETSGPPLKKTESPISAQNNESIYTNKRLSRKRNASSPSIVDDQPTNGPYKKLKSKMDAFLDNDAAMASAKIRLMSQMGQLGDDDGAQDVDDVRTRATEVMRMNVSEEERLPNDTTKATLDMIILVVGEVFGQRDLLEFREHWARDEVE